VFAARVPGDGLPACRFHLPPPPGARHFDGQAAAIEGMIESGLSPQPIGRNLLAAGVIEAAMLSHTRRGERVETPELSMSYDVPAESGCLRGDVTG
jgi:hypothetical protein